MKGSDSGEFKLLSPALLHLFSVLHIRLVLVIRTDPFFFTKIKWVCKNFLIQGLRILHTFCKALIRQFKESQILIVDLIVNLILVFLKLLYVTGIEVAFQRI